MDSISGWCVQRKLGENHESVIKINSIQILYSLVITTCIFTPYAMAFVPDFDLTMTLCDGVMNILFLFDIIIIFFSAYADADYKVIDDHSVRIIYIV
jgi:hypothetical protein